MVFLSACGYRLTGSGSLPSSLTCVSLGGVASDTREAGLESPLAAALDDALSRRALLCGASAGDPRLEGTLTARVLSMDLEPALLTSGAGGPAVVAYRVRVAVSARIEAGGKVVWEAGRLLASGELEAGAAVQADIGLRRTNAFRQLWNVMCHDVAERLVLDATSGL